MKYFYRAIAIRDRLGRWQFFRIPVGSWDCCGRVTFWEFGRFRAVAMLNRCYNCAKAYPEQKCFSSGECENFEPIQEILPKRVSFIRHMNYGSDVVIGNCPSCRSVLGKNNHPNFCGYCGQPVKWE